MSARTKARKRALDVLFQADIAGTDPSEVLDLTIARSSGPLNPYTETLVRGFTANRTEIDNLISESSNDWVLERMPTVDRNLLRIATYELLYEPSVPPAVVISEAVALASDLSTDESASFLNGVLGQLAKTQVDRSESTNAGAAPAPE